MEPADLPEMSDGERLWIVEALNASVDTKLVTKYQILALGEGDNKKMTLALGSAIELAVFPGQPRTTARVIFGSYLIERSTAQEMVNQFARDFGIVAQS